MSTHVVGIVPADKKYKQMKAAYDACVAAEIEIPEEVEKFFDGEEPEPSGMQMEIQSREWNDGEMCAGLEVVVHNIPKSVQVIRFYNSF